MSNYNNTTVSSHEKNINSKLPKVPGAYSIIIDNTWYYYGSSTNLYDRFINHRSQLRNNIHKNSRLQSHWNKAQSFELHVLKMGTKKEVLAVENMLLSVNFGTPQCLNDRDAYGSYEATDEHKANLSAAHKGKKPTHLHRKCWGKPLGSNEWTGFESLKAAAQHIGGQHNNICKVLNGSRAHHLGWTFTSTNPQTVS